MKYISYNGDVINRLDITKTFSVRKQTDPHVVHVLKNHYRGSERHYYLTESTLVKEKLYTDLYWDNLVATLFNNRNH